MTIEVTQADRDRAAKMDEGEALTKAIYRAAVKWCGEKNRETFPEDIQYFKRNWKHLAGLRSRVDQEMVLVWRDVS